MTGGLARDRRLERLARGDRRSGRASARSARPAPRRRSTSGRGRSRSPTLDRLKADPFAFYAKRDAQPAAARPGRRRPQRGVEGHRGPRRARTMARARTIATPTTCCRAPARCSPATAIHPMLRALWQPRLIEAIDWIAERGASQPRRRAAARWRPRSNGEAEIAGVDAERQGRPHRPSAPTAASRSSITRPARRPAPRRSRRASRSSSACSG